MPIWANLVRFFRVKYKKSLQFSNIELMICLSRIWNRSNEIETARRLCGLDAYTPRSYDDISIRWRQYQWIPTNFSFLFSISCSLNFFIYFFFSGQCHEYNCHEYIFFLPYGRSCMNLVWAWYAIAFSVHTRHRIACSTFSRHKIQSLYISYERIESKQMLHLFPSIPSIYVYFALSNNSKKKGEHSFLH